MTIMTDTIMITRNTIMRNMLMKKKALLITMSTTTVHALVKQRSMVLPLTVAILMQ